MAGDVTATSMCTRLCLAAAAAPLAAAVGSWPVAPRAVAEEPAAHRAAVFETSHACLACHNGLTTPSGADVSIGSDWRASMMANSARDPYWHAAVRRETLDHPAIAEAIEDECSICHMPMARTLARAAGRPGEIFAHLPVSAADTLEGRLAADGVSCALCHQIQERSLGSRESFTGGFVVDTSPAAPQRPMFGPFAIDAGPTSVMRSATGFTPSEATHIRQSELCATCHTLFTQAHDATGAVVGELPEQVPYLEWSHSAYRSVRSCQSCHMPVVRETTPIASVLGEPREDWARHVFRGGNFFMLRMLNRYRAELGVEALPQELDAAARATSEFLRFETASLALERVETTGQRLEIDVAIRNLTGHKLPTGYPARRVWLHLTVRDRRGGTVFESGALAPDGSITGNANDADAAEYEPHYLEITRPDEVQIYEAIMVDAAGGVTTGLLSGVRFVKDNRLLPEGFAKASAGPDIAVHGAAARDEDFTSRGDRVRYVLDVAGAEGPVSVEAALYFQPIAYRWARNLDAYESIETRRFTSYYDAMAGVSAEVLARTSASVDRAGSPDPGRVRP